MHTAHEMRLRPISVFRICLQKNETCHNTLNISDDDTSEKSNSQPLVSKDQQPYDDQTYRSMANNFKYNNDQTPMVLCRMNKIGHTQTHIFPLSGHPWK